jgi:hypothetical protein
MKSLQPARQLILVVSQPSGYMSARRKIIVYIATSADGYIARPDGDVGWLNRRPRTVDYGMREFYATIDTILWGRRTYDWLLNYHKQKGKTKGLFDAKLANYVFSRTPPKRAAPGAEFVTAVACRSLCCSCWSCVYRPSTVLRRRSITLPIWTFATSVTFWLVSSGLYLLLPGRGRFLDFFHPVPNPRTAN